MEIRDSRNGSWYWVNLAVNACPHISHADKAVYGALASFSNCKEIKPSFETISRRSNTSLRQAKRSIKSLMGCELVSIENYGRKGVSNVYLLLKAPKGCKKCQIDPSGKKCQIRPKEVPNEAKRSAKFAPELKEKIRKLKERIKAPSGY